VLSLNVRRWLEGLSSCEHIVQDAANSPGVDLHPVVEPLARFGGTPFFEASSAFDIVQVCVVFTLQLLIYSVGYVEVDDFDADLLFARLG
jgi:hypothetical protein